MMDQELSSSNGMKPVHNDDDDEIDTLETQSLLQTRQRHTTPVVKPSRGKTNCRRRFLILLLVSLAVMMVVKRLRRWALQRTTTRTFAPIPVDYGQDRQPQWTTPEYVDVNQREKDGRIERMKQLDSGVRFGACGGFERLDPDDSFLDRTNWTMHDVPVATTYSCPNGEDYNNFRHGRKDHDCVTDIVPRFVCEAPHPVLDNVVVTMERLGPFTGNGGYDWKIADDVPDIGMLRDRMANVDRTFVGALVAPVASDGTILSYPPIHIHHAHIFPYGDFYERGEKIRGSIGDHHDVMFQSHGDSECQAEDGGVACLLQTVPKDHGYVVHNSTSGISANFELNDVRPYTDSSLEYWFEITLLHTAEPPNQKSTFVGLNSPCFGEGPCTYMYPMDPHNNTMWFQYHHGDQSSELPNGKISDFILHTHQSVFDSAYLIKATNDNFYNALESYRDRKQLPLILDCHRGGMELEEAKTELLALIDQHQAQVICEAAKPSLWFVESENGVHGRDKRSQLNCLNDSVDLEIGDRLIVLAFNTVHENNYTRQSKEFQLQNPFSDSYAVYQHTIFRFTLAYDDAEYAPPSFFYYSDTGEGFLWALLLGLFNPDDYITATCPSTISYSMGKGWLSWLFGV